MEKSYLSEFYRKEVVPELKKLHGYKNIHEVPRLTKIVINTGFDSTTEKGRIEEIARDISNIAGQKAVVTKARKSVSNFKLREGMPIGAMVTLRGRRMYEFLYRLIAIALPGIRDFRGVKDRLDGSGNYTLGITDHSIFAEIHSDGSKQQLGMDISIGTTARTDAEARDLLRLLGMPFRKKNLSNT